MRLGRGAGASVCACIKGIQLWALRSSRTQGGLYFVDGASLTNTKELQ